LSLNPEELEKNSSNLGEPSGGKLRIIR